MNDLELSKKETKQGTMTIKLMEYRHITKDEVLQKQARFFGLVVLVALVCAAIVGMGKPV